MKVVRVVQEKLVDAIVGLVEKVKKLGGETPDAGAVLDGMAPPKHPPWFKFEGWMRAVVDLSDYAPGVKVILKGASLAGGTVLRRLIDAAPGKDIDMSIDAQTAFLQNHVAVVEGGEEGVAKATLGDLPLTTWTVDNWRNWASNLPEAIALRLATGIILFREEGSRLGNG